jgi:hypothetical protein
MTDDGQLPTTECPATYTTFRHGADATGARKLFSTTVKVWFTWLGTRIRPG